MPSPLNAILSTHLYNQHMWQLTKSTVYTIVKLRWGCCHAQLEVAVFVMVYVNGGP